MAKIGLKYPVYAKYNVDSNGAVTYSEGTNIGQAIKADVTINAPSTKLYADDEVAEEIREFIDGTISIETSDISSKNYADLLGHKTADSGEITSSGTDAPIYVGFGFYSRKVVDSVQSFRAIWFTKVIFGEPNDSFQTKAENITFNSHTIEGSIETDAKGIYKVEQTFKTEEEAQTWLKGKASITASESAEA